MDTDRDILILLGEIRGEIRGFIASQTAQDQRLDKHELIIAEVKATLSTWKGYLGAAVVLVPMGLQFLSKYLGLT